jgi:hypothetical protein
MMKELAKPGTLNKPTFTRSVVNASMMDSSNPAPSVLYLYLLCFYRLMLDATFGLLTNTLARGSEKSSQPSLQWLPWPCLLC